MTAAPPYPDPLPSGYRVGPYVVESELAPARWGRVYKAVHATLRETVAINVLASDLRDPDNMALFFDACRRALEQSVAEAEGDWRKMVARDFGQIDGVPFLVLAYAEATVAMPAILTE